MRSFTLIEAIFYVAIVSIIATFATEAIVSTVTIFGKARVKRTINEQGISVMERMLREIRLSDEIDIGSSILGSSPGKLSLNTIVSPLNETPIGRQFFIQGQNLILKEGSASSAPLTNNVRITKLLFRRINPIINAYYVRGSWGGCSNSANGTSPATAFCTISKAASVVVPGNTVLVGAGTYNETVVLTVSGTAGNYIGFIADTTGAYTGDAGSVIVDGGAYGFQFTSPGLGNSPGTDYILIDGFTITGSTSGIWSAHGSDFNVIRNSTITGNTNGIVLTNAWGNGSYAHATGWVIENNDILANITSGIYFANGEYTNTIVQNNRIYGNTRGISATDGGNAGFEPANNVTIQHNKIYGNVDYGIAGHVWFDGVIANNHIYNNAHHGIYYPYRSNSSLQPVTIRNNTINNNLDHGILFYTGMKAQTIIENNIVSDQVVGISSRRPFGAGHIGPCSPNVKNNNAWNNSSQNYAGGCSGIAGTEGNISANPLYVSAPADVHLQATATGHAANSPSIDTGFQSSITIGLDSKTTRIDGVGDAGTVDMGYHYGETPLLGPFLLSASANTESVRIELTIEGGQGRLLSSETFYGTAVLRRSY